MDVTSLGIPPGVFHRLLDFMYSGRLSIKDCDVMQREYPHIVRLWQLCLCLENPIRKQEAHHTQRSTRCTLRNSSQFVQDPATLPKFLLDPSAEHKNIWTEERQCAAFKMNSLGRSVAGRPI